MPSKICISWSLVRHGEFTSGSDVSEIKAVELGLECTYAIGPCTSPYVVYKAFNEYGTIAIAFPPSEQYLVQ